MEGSPSFYLRFRIPVDLQLEIRGIWNKALKEDPQFLYYRPRAADGEAGRVLYVVQERSEATKARLKVMGQLKETVEDLRNADGFQAEAAANPILIQWTPKFTIKCDDTGEMIAKITIDGELVTGAESTIQRTCGCAKDALRAAFVAHA